MSERRRDPLTGQWRNLATAWTTGSGDTCALCPTTDAAHPTHVPVPAYQLVVMDNRATQPEAAESLVLPPSAPYEAAPDVGADELLLYSDHHGQGFADLDPERAARLVDVWADRYALLGSRRDVGYVAVSELSRRDTPGSGAHPHQRIRGLAEIPVPRMQALRHADAYHRAHGTCVLCEIVGFERAHSARVVTSNEHVVAHVPFAPSDLFEVHVTPTRHVTSVLDLSDPERRSLAEALQAVASALRALHQSAAYVMRLHQSPTDDGEWLHVSHLHVDFRPLLAASPEHWSDDDGLLDGASDGLASPEAGAAVLRDALGARSA